MLENIFGPLSDWGLLILRLGLGIVLLAHGWPKLNPNGPMKGPAGVAGFLKQAGVPLPQLSAWVLSLWETVGAVLLILGVATRIISLGFVIDMVLAAVLVRIGMGKARFAPGEGVGWEFEFILGMVALALIFTGPGSLALNFLAGW